MQEEAVLNSSCCEDWCWLLLPWCNHAICRQNCVRRDWWALPLPCVAAGPLQVGIAVLVC